MELLCTRRWRLLSANGQSNLDIALHALSLLFWYFINTTAYHWAGTSLHLLLVVALRGLVCDNQESHLTSWIGTYASFMIKHWPTTSNTVRGELNTFSFTCTTIWRLWCAPSLEVMFVWILIIQIHTPQSKIASYTRTSLTIPYFSILASKKQPTVSPSKTSWEKTEVCTGEDCYFNT